MLLNYPWLADQKSFSPQSECSNLLFALLEDNVLCLVFYNPHFQRIKQKVYLLLEKLDQLRNLSIGLALLLILLVYISSS